MKSSYHAWVAAIRIARRDAWRAKGRSALVLSMIALPIIGVSAADLTMRSAELTPEQLVSRQIGAADARLKDSELNGPVYQDVEGRTSVPVGGYDKYDPRSEPNPNLLASVIPAGAQSLKDSTAHTKIRTRYGLLDTDLREIDTANPLVEGMITMKRGRAAQEAGEVVATTAFLETSGFFVGSEFRARGSDTWYRIVGAYELPSELKKTEVLAPPGTMITPLDKAFQAAGVPGVVATDSYLVKVGGDGFTWNTVKALNAKSVQVVSRAVQLDPPAESDVPYITQQKELGYYNPGNEFPTTELAVLATVVGLAMLEICLLAGPAFAVGARRSRRQLGLVGANGGDRRHIRAIVLSGGLVIGAAAAVIGTVLGVALTVGLRPLLEEYLGLRFGGFEFRPLEILGIALLAVLTGLLAAIAPAVTASRQTVLASLTGRRGIRRANRVLPAIGLIALAAGAAIALYGTASQMGATVVAGGSAIAELGIVALTPVLVGLFGRLGRWLPLSPRLALRDAVRNRGRTAPAVAAVLAAVAGTVAVATYQHSMELQARHSYVADLPAGSGVVALHELGRSKDMPAIREAVSQELPLAVRADVDYISYGKPGCERSTGSNQCGRAEIMRPKEQRCPLYEAPNGPDSFGPAERKKLRMDPRCQFKRHFTRFDTVVADEKLLTALAVTDPGSASALKEGKAVSFEKRNVKDGNVTVRLIDDKDDKFEPGTDPKGVDKVFAVHQAPDAAEGYGIELVLPPSAAKSAGLTTMPFASYFTLDGTADSKQKQRVAGRIDQIGVEAPVTIEAGYQGERDLTLLALTVFAGLVTIGAAGIATGLAQADAEADLKTLAAVGAPPRVRRTLSGFQCGVVALMGVVLGSAAGILPAVGLRLVQRREAAHLMEISGGPDDLLYVPISVPWETLGGLLVLVPLGAALLAALVTKSGGALSRRAAG
ncbi:MULTISPECIES: ABC transporter permease [unclassified Streptomyces]|uniref:ABC transporter permease n=1 Tax=unclassified Streptomyces TaxID=2593676 RepID=UPI002E0DD303|nr:MULTISPECIES: ABC transporter permease [unclassified Streptomyces]WSR27004.1 ABC transporter permease [Streptomyces sp. NBC_01205]